MYNTIHKRTEQYKTGFNKQSVTNMTGKLNRKVKE